MTTTHITNFSITDDESVIIEVSSNRDDTNLQPFNRQDFLSLDHFLKVKRKINGVYEEELNIPYTNYTVNGFNYYNKLNISINENGTAFSYLNNYTTVNGITTWEFYVYKYINSTWTLYKTLNIISNNFNQVLLSNDFLIYVDNTNLSSNSNTVRILKDNGTDYVQIQELTTNINYLINTTFNPNSGIIKPFISIKNNKLVFIEILKNNTNTVITNSPDHAINVDATIKYYNYDSNLNEFVLKQNSNLNTIFPNLYKIRDFEFNGNLIALSLVEDRTQVLPITCTKISILETTEVGLSVFQNIDPNNFLLDIHSNLYLGLLNLNNNTLTVGYWDDFINTTTTDSNVSNPGFNYIFKLNNNEFTKIGEIYPYSSDSINKVFIRKYFYKLTNENLFYIESETLIDNTLLPDEIILPLYGIFENNKTISLKKINLNVTSIPKTTFGDFTILGRIGGNKINFGKNRVFVQDISYKSSVLNELILNELIFNTLQYNRSFDQTKTIKVLENNLNGELNLSQNLNISDFTGFENEIYFDELVSVSIQSIKDFTFITSHSRNKIFIYKLNNITNLLEPFQVINGEIPEATNPDPDSFSNSVTFITEVQGDEFEFTTVENISRNNFHFYKLINNEFVYQYKKTIFYIDTTFSNTFFANNDINNQFQSTFLVYLPIFTKVGTFILKNSPPDIENNINSFYIDYIFIPKLNNEYQNLNEMEYNQSNTIGLINFPIFRNLSNSSEGFVDLKFDHLKNQIKLLYLNFNFNSTLNANNNASLVIIDYINNSFIFKESVSYTISQNIDPIGKILYSKDNITIIKASNLHTSNTSDFFLGYQIDGINSDLLTFRYKVEDDMIDSVIRNTSYINRTMDNFDLPIGPGQIYIDDNKIFTNYSTNSVTHVGIQHINISPIPTFEG